jgi:hypothetical protein
MDFQSPVSTWPEFQTRWSGLHNFLMTGDLTDQFACDLPPLEQIIDEVRTAKNAVVRSGVKQAEFDQTDIPEARTMPLEKLLARPFILAHFRLHETLGGKGQAFEGLEEQWVEPWRKKLSAHGFTYEYVYSIVFISGPHSATNYHMDYTHQLAWQRYGTKHFSGLKDPDRWTTRELRGKCELAGMTKPAEVSDADVYSIVQPPGTKLWNALTTPHWVETFDEPALTLTLVHSNLRLNGKLCPHADELLAWRAEQAASQPASQPAASGYAK